MLIFQCKLILWLVEKLPQEMGKQKLFLEFLWPLFLFEVLNKFARVKPAWLKHIK